MKKLSAEDNNELENYITELNDHASKIETRMHEANERIVDLNDEI